MTGLLHTHSLLRWIMLILLIITIVRAYGGWKGNRQYHTNDRKLALYTFIFAHLQLLIGFVLYFVSPTVKLALADMGSAMKDKVLRFWAVEHILTMVIAILLITIGYSLAKRAANDIQRYKAIFMYYLAGLILILISIPWPFLKVIGQGRGWF